MKKMILMCLIVLKFLNIEAQQANDSTNTPALDRKFPKIKFYGIIRTDFYYNSRQMEEGSEGFVLLFPKTRNFDVNGTDLNAKSMMGMTATATRFGIDMEPFYLKALKSTITGRIETDFQGYAGSVTMLRIRHAWINMAFKSADLLVGQYWHPLYEGVAPSVLDLNGGQPYQPFGRHPQVKFTYRPKNLKLFVAANYQTQFASTGVNADGGSVKGISFQKHALLPDWTVGAEYGKEAWKVGIMGEYKQIIPRTAANITDGNGIIQTVAVNEKVQSYALATYGQLKINTLILKAHAMLGQNMSDLSMSGGYAATAENEKGERSYKPFNVLTAWFNADYTFAKNWQASIFGGYSQNLGTTGGKLLSATGIYGNLLYGGKLIDRQWRASAMLSYQFKSWKAALEYSWNSAYYGTPNLSTGKAIDVEKGVDGSRLLAVLMYSF